MSKLGLFASSVYAKKVATCSSYLVGATAEITCVGDYNGKTTMVKLYKIVDKILAIMQLQRKPNYWKERKI